MEIRNVNRADLKPLMESGQLTGKMLIGTWPRLTAKRKRNAEGFMETLEAAGTLIRRRFIIRPDNSKPTKDWTPKGGIMFNAATQAQAAAIRAPNGLFLAWSLEGITHPHGEKDHHVNFPTRHAVELYDTIEKVLYRVVDPE